MAGSNSDLTFRLLGKDISASKAFKNLEGNAAATQSRFGSLGGAMSKLGAIAGTVAVGVAAVGAGLLDAAQAAAQDQKSSAVLDKTLQSVTKSTQKQVDATEDWIDKLQRASGVADDNLRPALAQLVRATGDVSKAQGLMQLALDVSAGTGRDLQSVTVALGKAYNGNTAGLAKLGVAVKDTHGKTLTYSQIVDKLSKQFNGQAATAANTYEGKMAKLGIAFDEFKESIGYKVLPVLESFADWMTNTGEPMIEKMVSAVQQSLTPALDNARKSFADMGRTIKENKQFFDDLSKIAIPVMSFGFQSLANNIRGANVVLSAFGKAGSAVENWYRGLEEAVKRAGASIISVVLTFKWAFNKLADEWNRTFGSMSFDLPGPLGGGHIGFPQMPHLAKGGIVTRPTIALIGERGPEAVVPLSRGGYSGGPTIIVQTFPGSELEVSRVLSKYIRVGKQQGLAF